MNFPRSRGQSDYAAVFVGCALNSNSIGLTLVERADVRDASGRKLTFGFPDFVPVGLVCFVAILAIGISQAVLRVR